MRFAISTRARDGSYLPWERWRCAVRLLRSFCGEGDSVSVCCCYRWCSPGAHLQGETRSRASEAAAKGREKRGICR